MWYNGLWVGFSTYKQGDYNMSKKSSKKASKKLSKKALRLVKYLPSIRNPTTYGEVAKRIDSVGMAVGQLLRPIYENYPHLRKYTKLIKSAA